MRNTNEPSSPAAARAHAIEGLIAGLGRALGELKCVGSQRFVKLGVSMTHLHVLTMLRHHGAMPMSKLAELLDVSFSNATGIVDRLEERGYVERYRVPDDRRVVLVKVTPAAEHLLEEADLLRSDFVAAVLGRLDLGQLSNLETAVADIRDAVALELASAPERYRAISDHVHDHVPGFAHVRPAGPAATEDFARVQSPVPSAEPSTSAG